MSQIGLLRFVLIVSIGLAFYFSLLFALGMYEGGHIKRRKKLMIKATKIPRSRILFIYLLSLVTAILLLFILIKYRIRGVT